MILGGVNRINTFFEQKLYFEKTWKNICSVAFVKANNWLKETLMELGG